MNTKSSKETLEILDNIINEKLTFGKMLANIRECEGLTQTEFARILGVSRHYLCDIEHDKRSVSVVKAYEYATKLGFSAKQFVSLALQDQVDKAGINLIIDVSNNNSVRR